jgi:hypothetical protein
MKLNDLKEKTYPKTFGTRLPESIALKLLEMDKSDRTMFIRNAIIKEVLKNEENSISTID